MHGYGEFYWPDGKKYFGYYVNDKKEGFGMFMWSDHPKLKAYIGFWKDGKQHGVGIMVSKNTIKYTLWKNGEKHMVFQGCWEMKRFIEKNDLPYTSFLESESNIFLDILSNDFINPVS